MKKILDKIITFGIIILVGSSISREINKQLPKELQVNIRKIFIRALLFGLACGFIAFIISSLIL